MQTTAHTVIHMLDGNCYEVDESFSSIAAIMQDTFVPPTTFINLRFPDGGTLYVKKGCIAAFYQAD